MASSGRMLLSHNFTLSDGAVAVLTREQFVNVFKNGLPGLEVSALDHPHWSVAVSYSETEPAAVGQQVAEALARYRRGCSHTVAALGGQKTTPATSAAGLQTGEWGVDVVETKDLSDFLQQIGWDAAVAARPADQIFRIEVPIA